MPNFRALCAIARFASRFFLANPARLIVLVAGSASIALAAAAIILAASTSSAVVQQAIDANWRGAYDILVRVDETPSGELVPADYLGTPGPGITRDQWQQIQQIPGIEVAAPVAALGWLRNDAPSVGVQIDSHPNEVVQIEVRVDLAGQPAVENVAYWAPPVSGGEGPPVNAGVRSYVGASDSTVLSVSNLPPVWGLVVGIDPPAEQALLNLQGWVQGDYLTSGIRTEVDPVFGEEAIVVPVLTASSAPIPGSVQVSVWRLAGMGADDVAERVKQAAEANPPATEADAIALIKGATDGQPWTMISSGTIGLDAIVKPLRTSVVGFTPDGGFSVDGVFGGDQIVTHRDLVLVPGTPSYERDSSGNLRLSQTGTWVDSVEPALRAATPPGWVEIDATFGGDEAIFRPLMVSKPPLFALSPVGTYDLSSMSEEFTAAPNYVPLGIYSDVPLRRVDLLTGNLEQVPHSLNPGGVNPLPPIGLTNLEAVEALRGASFIDAIRVRVSGISDYGPDSVKRVEDVAAAIVARTGLRVDVVAGSSPVDVAVDIEGRGPFVERWTTLGTVPLIRTGMDGLSGALLLLALGIGILYLATSSALLVADQAAELATLSRVGWRRRQRAALLAIQGSALGIAAACLTGVLVLLVSWVSGIHLSAELVVGAMLAVAAAHTITLSLIGPALVRASHRVGGVEAGLVGDVYIGSQLGMLLRLALEAPGRAALVIVALTGASALAGSLLLLQAGLSGQVRGTVLGEFIWLRVAPYHLLAAGAAVFAAAAVALDVGFLSVYRRVALIGTLRAVGWRAAGIRRLVTGEIAFLGVLAGIAAALLVAGLGVIVSSGPSTLWVALAVAAGTTVLAVTAAHLPSRVAAHVTPLLALRADGSVASIPTLTAVQTFVSVSLLVLVVLVGATGWTIIAPSGIAPTASIATPSPRPTSAAEERIAAHLERISSSVDRQPGTVSLAEAQLYAEEQLEAAGFETERQPFFVRDPIYLDASGQEVVVDLLPVSLAYPPVDFAGSDLEEVASFEAADGRTAEGCPPGILIVRISDEGQQAQLAAGRAYECEGETTAVLSVKGSDADWLAARQSVARVRFAAADHLWACSSSCEDVGLWFVAQLDSTGPGASQSAAAVAVLLELAREAGGGSEVGIGVLTATGGGAVSQAVRHLAGLPVAVMVELGELGGPLAEVVGPTQWSAEPDLGSISAGLLASITADKASVVWLDRVVSVEAPLPAPASLLDSLTEATGLPAAEEHGRSTSYALAAGLPAAYLGASQAPGGPIRSIAGTAADRPAQVDVARLARILSGLRLVAS